MAHNRNLISNGNPMEAIVGFSRAVRVGQFIAVCGTAPVDKDGNTVGVGDVFLQTKQCFEIIKAAIYITRFLIMFTHKHVYFIRRIVIIKSTQKHVYYKFYS